MIDLRLFSVIPGPEFYGIFGVMGANKTKRIVTIGDQLSYGGVKYLALKPQNNLRGNEGLDKIIARDNTWIPGMTIPEDDFSSAVEALDRDLKIQVVILDEYHMFKPEAVLQFIENARVRRLHVLFCGLVSDSGGVPFELYPYLSSLVGENREDMAGYCKITPGCNRKASFNQAIFPNGTLVPYDPTARRKKGNVVSDSSSIIVEEKVDIKYIPACNHCFKLPPGAPASPLDHLRTGEELLRVRRV
jgi:thymidine kinase